MSNETETERNATADRRLFAEQLRTRTAFVACDLGIARASLAGGRVGKASIVERCTATSVVADEDRVVAGSTRGVLVDTGEGFERLGEPFEVAAVGLAEGRILAAGEGGRVLAWAEDRGWETVGEVDGPARFDGALLAADSGVYRVAETLDPLGLSGVNDVDSEGPFAATDDGIYRRGADRWDRGHSRPAATVVAAGGAVHAVDDRGALDHAGGLWERVDVPALPVDLSYAGVLCGVTGNGTIVVSEPDEYSNWRTHPLGLRGAVEFDMR
jgi:hypothetical protein